MGCADSIRFSSGKQNLAFASKSSCSEFGTMNLEPMSQPKTKGDRRHRPRWPYQAVGENRLKLKYSSTSKRTLNKVWCSKSSSCFFVVETSQCG